MPSCPETIPVLMYHKVGYPVSCPRDAFLNIPGEAFRRQMRAMRSLGYRARPFGEVVDALNGGQTLPRRTFAVTFDDGYECVGAVAAPILADFGFPATVFVVSNCVGGTNAWDRALGNPELPLMDWAELRRLATDGWEIGGHTRSHRHLGALSDADALREIRDGKEETEAQMDQCLTTFCYPFGHLNAATPGLVRAAGFLGACTTRSGLARAVNDPFQQPRVKVYHASVAALLYRLFIRPRLPEFRRHRYQNPME